MGGTRPEGDKNEIKPNEGEETRESERKGKTTFQNFTPILFLVNLLLTPMALVVVPPPMFAHCFKAHCSINQITFHPSCRDIALLLSDGTLAILKNIPLSKETGHNTSADEKTSALLPPIRYLVLSYMKMCPF